LVEAARAVRVLLATGLTALGALGASRAPWHAATAVGSAREAAISDWLSRSTETWNWPKSTQVQDPLSVRMICQVFATGVESLLGAGRALEAATAQVDDNPVIDGEAVLTSGGSLPLDVSLQLQGTQLSLAHIARNTFNRCVLLGNGGRSLPVNLVPSEAGATGFGPMLKLAGDLFARLLSLSLPVSAQAMVVAGGMEDEAAFLPLIIERLEEQVAALKGLAAIEAILAAQAIYLTGDTPSGVAGVINACVREHMAPYTVDRPLSAEIEAVEASLNGPALRKALLAASHLSDFDTFFSLDLFA
ncbi:MAG: histidine ammonia-lyase, partial [Alphaproteobacteria bacterium]